MAFVDESGGGGHNCYSSGHKHSSCNPSWYRIRRPGPTLGISRVDRRTRTLGLGRVDSSWRSVGSYRRDWQCKSLVGSSLGSARVGPHSKRGSSWDNARSYRTGWCRIRRPGPSRHSPRGGLHRCQHWDPSKFHRCYRILTKTLGRYLQEGRILMPIATLLMLF